MNIMKSLVMLCTFAAAMALSQPSGSASPVSASVINPSALPSISNGNSIKRPMPLAVKDQTSGANKAASVLAPPGSFFHTSTTPTSSDPSVINQPAGAVRVNPLKNLEMAMGIGANILEIIFIIVGIWILRKPGINTKLMGLLTIAIGMGLPSALNWVIASARDANLCG